MVGSALDPDRIERKLRKSGCARRDVDRYMKVCLCSDRPFFVQESFNAFTKRMGIVLLGVTLAASIAACGGGRKRRALGGALIAGGGAGRPEGRSSDGRQRQGHGRARRRAPKNEAIKMNADPVCVRENKGTAGPGNLHGRRRRQVARQRVRVREGRPRQLRLRHADRAGEDRPEGMPLPSARVRDARRPAARDPQQRPDAAQHPRPAEGEHGVQHRPADSGHEDDAHLRQARK